MDRRYRNIFDQIHMSAACQDRILAAASSASAQEDQSAMKKPRTVLKTMLLAAALAGCLSAVAYASNNMLPEQLNQLSNVTLSNANGAKTRQEQDGSTTYMLERDNGKVEINVSEPELIADNMRVYAAQSTDGQANLEIIIDDAK